MERACAILSSVACPGLQYFSTLSHKRLDSRGKKKKVIEHKTCVFIISTMFETVITLRTERDITKLYIGLHVKYPLFLSDFNKT